MSRLRDQLKLTTEGELAPPPTADGQPYEVFIQLQRGKPHIYAGTVDAIDPEQALLFAREHYGRDQPCVHVWVFPRSAGISTGHDNDLVWRNSDQSYRQARGYQVRKKWEKFRTKQDVDEYEKGDLKEAF